MIKPRSPALVLAAIFLAAAGAAAQTAEPVATAVGQDTCTSCHEEVTKQFDRSAHGALAEWEVRGQLSRCESCHGPGSLHVESGGDATKIRGLKDASDPGTVEACLTCHRRDHAMDWAGSAHAASSVGCVSCHKVHQSRQVFGTVTRAEGMTPNHSTAPAPRGSLTRQDGPLGRGESQVCFDCHPEQRAQFMQSSRHPVREGYMTCSSCHAPHGRGLGMLKTDERVNELCTSCHARQAGPFVFEHAPVQESCLTCHAPHGAVANSLLKQGEPFLCLQCHEMHFHNARISATGPYSLPSGSVTNPNGNISFMAAFNTRCSNCHTKIHGSDLPSQGTTGRGQALTR